MKSTTIRFADPVYQQLEAASRGTGLPINSIVVVACLDWLQNNQPVSLAPPLRPVRARRLQQTVGVGINTVPIGRSRPSMLAGKDPLYIFTASAQDALANAQEEAERTQRWIGTEHLVHGLYVAEEGRAAQALRSLDVDVEAIRAGIVAQLPGEKGRRLLPTSQLRETLKRAKEEMGREGTAQLGTDHLLLGLLLEGESRVGRALEAQGVSYRLARDLLATLPPEI
jgi:Clp amino terminal domain, pathogenicity island component